jgi:hypothetical membrane protein
MHLRRVAQIAGVVGPVVFITSWVVAGALRDGYDPMHDAISRLAELGAPNRWIVTAGMVTFGAAVPIFARLLSPGARLFAVVAGLSSLAVAAFPCSEGCPGDGEFTDTAHGLAAGAHYVSLIAMGLVASRSVAARAVVLAAGGALLLHASGIGPNGGLQRLGLTTLDLWMITLAVRPWTARDTGAPA